MEDEHTGCESSRTVIQSGPPEPHTNSHSIRVLRSESPAKWTPPETMTCSSAFGCVRSEQLQLFWVRVWTLELAAIKWRQLLIEAVLPNEDLEHVLDLLGDFTTSPHSLAEL